MKWIKLTLLEAGFLKDTIEEMESEREYADPDNRRQAIDLLDGAIYNAIEEEIKDG